MSTIIAALDSAADLLLGWRCPGCDRPAFRLCPQCRGRLLSAPPRRAVRGLAGYPPTWAAADYDDLPRRLITAYKDRSASFLVGPLGCCLARAVLSLGLSAGREITLVPVPSSAAAVRRRGVDAMRVLAARAAGRLRRSGRRVRVRSLLGHRRAVADQAGLDPTGRMQNLSGSMRVRSTCRTPVVVVDDVTTTGATLVEATRALRRAGVEVLGAAVVATTELRAHSGSAPMVRKSPPN